MINCPCFMLAVAIAAELNQDINVVDVIVFSFINKFVSGLSPLDERVKISLLEHSSFKLQL